MQCNLCSFRCDCLTSVLSPTPLLLPLRFFPHCALIFTEITDDPHKNCIIHYAEIVRDKQYFYADMSFLHNKTGEGEHVKKHLSQ